MNLDILSRKYSSASGRVSSFYPNSTRPSGWVGTIFYIADQVQVGLNSYFYPSDRVRVGLTFIVSGSDWYLVLTFRIRVGTDFSKESSKYFLKRECEKYIYYETSITHTPEHTSITLTLINVLLLEFWVISLSRRLFRERHVWKICSRLENIQYFLKDILTLLKQVNNYSITYFPSETLAIICIWD